MISEDDGSCLSIARKLLCLRRRRRKREPKHHQFSIVRLQLQQRGADLAQELRVSVAVLAPIGTIAGAASVAPYRVRVRSRRNQSKLRGRVQRVRRSDLHRLQSGEHGTRIDYIDTLAEVQQVYNEYFVNPSCSEFWQQTSLTSPNQIINNNAINRRCYWNTRSGYVSSSAYSCTFSSNSIRRLCYCNAPAVPIAPPPAAPPKEWSCAELDVIYNTRTPLNCDFHTAETLGDAFSTSQPGTNCQCNKIGLLFSHYGIEATEMTQEICESYYKTMGGTAAVNYGKTRPCEWIPNFQGTTDPNEWCRTTTVNNAPACSPSPPPPLPPPPALAAAALAAAALAVATATCTPALVAAFHSTLYSAAFHSTAFRPTFHSAAPGAAAAIATAADQGGTARLGRSGRGLRRVLHAHGLRVRPGPRAAIDGALRFSARL